MLTLAADVTMLGRAFVYALAAVGRRACWYYARHFQKRDACSDDINSALVPLLILNQRL